MAELVAGSLKHAIMITVFVFIMMMIIDYINVLTRGRLGVIVKGGRMKQYFITSFMGVTPGCLGAFTNVSFYMRGLITIGALAGGMIATSGDEAFVMLGLFPMEALLLFGIQFVIGVAGGFLIDLVIKKFRIKTKVECGHEVLHDDEDCRILTLREIWSHLKKMSFNRFLLFAVIVTAIVFLVLGVIGPETWDWMRVTFLILSVFALFIVISVPDHYLTHHIWDHIFKKHLWRIFLWSFGVIFLVDAGLRLLDIETFIKNNLALVVLIAGLIGLIPESGPHLIFVVLFSKGLIPFSVLLTSSIVQDGHGMLPLLSFSFADSLKIKLFNLGIGLIVGFSLFFLHL